MQAIVVNDDTHLVWREVAEPRPNHDDVIIDIHAAALNRADLLQRAGLYPPPPGWPEWMGLEVAGVIAQAPPNGRWRVGDRVCALLGGGGYAERVAVPQGLVLPLPRGLSMVEGAALPEVFATAYLNLCLEGGLKAGDTVFIQAGASGLGIAAIQLVTFLGGKVVTSVGSEKKAAFVRSLGADVVINHTIEDIGAVLQANPVTIALDCVAGPRLGQYLGAMAPGGRWIVIATLGGPTAEVNINDFFRRGLKLIGSTLRSRPPETKRRILAELEERFWAALETGKIRPVIHATLPISEAEEAHAILERRENIGKVVLTVKDES